jgi:hypothetical protein
MPHACRSKRWLGALCCAPLLALAHVRPAIADTAAVADNPNAPVGAHGWTPAWTPAPVLAGPVAVTPAGDSVRLTLPTVSGARDYRVFAIHPSLEVWSAGAGEHVHSVDVFCAGDTQFNAPRRVPPVVMNTVEVFGVAGETRLVIEALGAPCPFTGVRGAVHYETTATNTEVPAADRVPFSIVTDAEVRSAYGAVIYNGHGPGARLAAPAAAADPPVLARTTVWVTPRLDAVDYTVFDDFTADDPPRFVRTLPTFSDRNSNAQVHQNDRWGFYSYNYDRVDYSIDRGQLQTVLADRWQDVFATDYFTAKRTAQLGSSDYLRVHFMVNSDATQRRYWWFFLCGAGTAGATLDAQGLLKGNIVQTSFFYQADGMNPSVEGWNCLQVFPRDGMPFALAPNNQRPQSDIRVMVNLPGALGRNNVVNVSPPQYANPNISPPGWFRMRDAGGALVAPILDDQMSIAPRTTYDLFIRRDRVILYVNGQQRLCNDFPSVKLTMAEGAVGFGQVLYHSAAERLEFSQSFNDRTGQRYYMTNTPYIDVRSWDEAGFAEHVAAPAGFDASVCYVYSR